MDVISADKLYIAGTYRRAPVVFVEGKGSLLYDEKSAEYIDFGSGIAVAGLGHGNAAWLKAVTGQLGRLPHASNLYYTEPAARLAEKLCQRTGMKKVFLCNSGAEANECAIKAARKFGEGAGKTEILTLENSFHGRTVATLAATGQEALRKHFGPFPEGFAYARPNDIADLEAKFSDKTAAVMLELVQGEGGVTALGAEFVKRAAELCAASGALLVIDEVQTGNGRTGTLYAYMDYGVSPDIVTTAKGLGNGLPIGACMFAEKTEGVLEAGEHGSTFGGNPAVCAGACAVLDQIDGELLAGVREKSARIRAELAACPGVKGLSGKGLMIGIECEDAKETAAKCLERGLVVLTAHEKIRLLPALNIGEKELVKGLKILKEVLNGETLT